MNTHTNTNTLRIPKGLWDDLEETVIHQDRSFLTEVARSLGLPVADVLRKCLGTGENKTVPVLWYQEQGEDCCPWWEKYGALWRPCMRPRLSPTLPCYKHERTSESSTTKLCSDPTILGLPARYPVRRNGLLYWVSETDPIPLSEDGNIVPDYTCRIYSSLGRTIAIWKET
jgi:hypothetical protein